MRPGTDRVCWTIVRKRARALSVGASSSCSLDRRTKMDSLINGKSISGSRKHSQNFIMMLKVGSIQSRFLRCVMFKRSFIPQIPTSICHLARRYCSGTSAEEGKQSSRQPRSVEVVMFNLNTDLISINSMNRTSCTLGVVGKTNTVLQWHERDLAPSRTAFVSYSYEQQIDQTLTIVEA